MGIIALLGWTELVRAAAKALRHVKALCQFAQPSQPPIGCPARYN
jgi:hypothetical protein